MAVNLANEVWQEIKRYVNGMDRAEAAEALVSVLIDNDVSAEEIKVAFKSDSEVKQALKQYLDDHADEEEDDDEYEYDDEDDEDDKY
jgi:preprotein translocase subunit Sec63